MSDVDLVLRSTRVITPEGTRAASVAVAGGKIAAVLPHDAEVPAGARLEDFGDDVLLPGLVDTHVHVNDPGRTEWEGFWTATRAAAAGGITTLLDMPLNSLPPTTTVENLRTKQDVARSKAHIDVGFWGGAIPSNVKDLRPLYDAGVFGFKCFLSPSGVEEFPELDQEQLARSMAEISGFGGQLIVHAEDPHHLEAAPQKSGPAYVRLPRLPAARRREHRDREPDRARQAPRRPRPRTAPVVLGRAAAHRRRQARRRTDHGRVLPALPHPHRRGSPGRGHRVQVLPADPRGREPGRAVGGARGRHDRLHRLRPLALHHRPQDPRLRLRVGRDLLAPAGPVGDLDRGPAPRPLAGGRRPLDVRRAGRTGGAVAEGCHRGRPRRRLRGPRPRRDLHVDPAELRHRNQVTAYAGKTLHGVVRSTWLRGVRIADNGTLAEPTGRLLERNN